MYYIVHSMRQLTHALEPPVTARANARLSTARDVISFNGQGQLCAE